MAYIFRGVELPEHLQDSLDRYAEQGVPCGDFLRACIDSDLMSAVKRADDRNIWLLPVIAAYIYNELPMEAQGRKGAHDEWVDAKMAEREKERV